VGEGTMVATAPAIANAIYDAIGIRFHEIPITPEKVLKALKEKKA
jgi:CO/xanthine dehydrogenase Mo-binding subunit